MKQKIQQAKSGDKTLISTHLGLIPTWRFELLRDMGAIRVKDFKKGECVISCEYPKLMVNDGGLSKSFDYSGDLSEINRKLVEFTNNKKSAWIEYFPKLYSNFLEAEKEINDEKFKQEKALEYEQQSLSNL